MTLGELNALPREAAERELKACCGSSRWAVAMAACRPFRGDQELFDSAEAIWRSLEGGDWLEAFSQHPRIGERAGGRARDEQAGVRGAPDAVLTKLAERNHDYERKFGHVFLICATGRSAQEMLANLEERMRNEPAKELRIAADEQAKITRLRLEKLLSRKPQASGAR